MKRNRIVILLTLLFAILFSNNIFASRDINIFIDGEEKVFSPPPVIQDGTTLVPMRDCFETLGSKIFWLSSTRTALAFRDGVKIKVTINNNEAFVNSNEIYLSVAPQIIGESTYVPLRFVSEALGAKVYWDGDTRTITILDKLKENDFVDNTGNPPSDQATSNTNQALNDIAKYQLLDTQKYELKTTFSFLNNGDNIEADFDILMGGISNSPYQQDSEINITPTPNEIYYDNYGNKYAKLNFQNIKKGQAINIILTKELSNSGIKYNVQEDSIKNDYKGLDNYQTFISPQNLIESDNPEIIEKANALAKDETNPYKIAKKVFEFVNQYLTYDTSDKYARKGALNALNTGRGLCEDYSKLFVALLRAKNIPARSVFGYWITDEIRDDINYDSWYDLKDIPHEWPEFYLEGYGWVIAEPTFDYTINGVKTVPWDQFANQDTNGHIIYGYEPDSEDALKWSVKGYGTLDLQYKGMKSEIKKIK